MAAAPVAPAVVPAASDPVADFVASYSKYLEYPELTAAQAREIDAKLENMLLKLDEFNAVFERVKVDAAKVYQLNSTELSQQAAQLQAAFEIVDRLEVMLGHVRSAVNRAEDIMRLAEDQLDQSTLKKTWKLIPGVGGSAPPAPVAIPPLPKINASELLTELQTPVAMKQ